MLKRLSKNTLSRSVVCVWRLQVYTQVFDLWPCLQLFFAMLRIEKRLPRRSLSPRVSFSHIYLSSSPTEVTERRRMTLKLKVYYLVLCVKRSCRRTLSSGSFRALTLEIRSQISYIF